MNTKQLRQKILDLAIRGELIPQDPTDEPASVLLERIRAEKEQLIKDKKLKRDKKDNEPIDEVPFELPEGWEWCRLKEVTTELKYGTSEKSSLEGKIPVLRMGNITTNGTIDYSNIVFSSNEEDIKEFLLTKGNLVFNRTNSSDLVGKTAIYRGEMPAIFAGYLIKIALLKVNPEYTNLVMNSSYYRKWCYSVKSDAVNQSNINAEKLSNLLISLPPLAEQHRIVQKVGQLLTIVDTIEQLQEELKALVKQTKNQVLNYAIAGKLTHQDPNDEPAEALLKRVGKTTTTAADTPYEKLPKGWVWCRLGDIANIQTGKKDANYGDKNGKYPFFTCALLPIRCNNYSFDMEAVLLPGNGANVGEVVYFKGKFEAYQRTYILNFGIMDKNVAFFGYIASNGQKCCSFLDRYLDNTKNYLTFALSV